MHIKRTSRDILIEHIDGPVAFCAHAGSPRMQTVRSMLLLGWLRTDRVGFPRFTIITRNGRGALAEALADWADAMERARFGREHRTDILQAAE